MIVKTCAEVLLHLLHLLLLVAVALNLSIRRLVWEETDHLIDG